MIGAVPNWPGEKGGGYGAFGLIFGKDAAAERGRGPLRPGKPGMVPGRPCWVGVKSKRGARRGAIPYWTASSRPRSRGILRDNAVSVFLSMAGRDAKDRERRYL